MRSYDQPDLLSYGLGSLNFTSASDITIPCPPDCSGLLIRGYAIDTASVAFTADTTPAALQFGDGTTTDKFGQLDAAVIAAGDSLHVVGTGDGIALNYASATGARLDQITVTVVAPTGGTPGGTGNVTLFLAWY